MNKEGKKREEKGLEKWYLQIYLFNNVRGSAEDIAHATYCEQQYDNALYDTYPMGLIIAEHCIHNKVNWVLKRPIDYAPYRNNEYC